MGMESIIPGTTKKWSEPESPVRTANVKVHDRVHYIPNYDAIKQNGMESAMKKTGPMVGPKGRYAKE